MFLKASFSVGDLLHKTSQTKTIFVGGVMTISKSKIID